MSIEVFSTRHIGPRQKDVDQMLVKIGVKSIDQLIEETVPSAIRLKKPLDVGAAMTEHLYLNHIKSLAGKNKIFRSYIGLGYNRSITPSPIQRNILENPGWYTAYTPYQAEISQGRLEALLNYQTMVLDLTGMEIANASLLDEATAAAECMYMFLNGRTKEAKKTDAMKFFVSEQCLPQTIALLQTRAKPLNIELVIGNHETYTPDSSFFGAIVQYPAATGEIYNYEAFTTKAKAAGVRVGVAADIMSLALLKAPGAWGADCVFGSTQRFGIPLGYGGPHAAFFGCKDEFKRYIPGRIIGVSVDANGNRALRMALQTREQHIKRDKATSNICTAQVLLAVMAGMYAVYHGSEGIKAIATNIKKMAEATAKGLEKLGYKQTNKNFFDTIRIDLGSVSATKLKEIALAQRFNLNYIDASTVSISTNEAMYIEDVNELIAVFAKAKGIDTIKVSLDGNISVAKELARTTPFLTHEVFNKYHSESELMRYIKSLENKDYSLTHGMIPLGSCTMKLNAASELLPLSWPEFANIHPFVPKDQAQGYQEMIKSLEDKLSIITGFDATTLQPNSGAQGEYAGLMVIREYHLSRGDHHRNIVLIPSSAHGTNPASAVVAGMEVVVTKCDEAGNIDVEDLKAKAEEHSANLSALMVTYPSTHGVFEESIIEITNIIHKHGGQVYMDGANMNAQVGLTSPGNIGADVCHLNLHKTFAIPHGGGGPGVGPICMKAHLAPFMPSSPVVATGGNQPIPAISAAPWGSALVCIISYGYICMLGSEGLKKATEYAILNANYIKTCLEGTYGILYSGKNGKCAHEMIVECRDFKQESGIDVTDIAKRLMDYGFHAPTLSFPVPGTLMIEPTESESKEELDRFIEAMVSVRKEVQEVIEGKYPQDNNVLVNAPHTAKELLSETWNKPYSREKAAYGVPRLKDNKFWPSVKRVDNAAGDRNLICSCVGIEAFEEPQVV